MKKKLIVPIKNLFMKVHNLIRKICPHKWKIDKFYNIHDTTNEDIIYKYVYQKCIICGEGRKTVTKFKKEIIQSVDEYYWDGETYD